MRSRPPSAMRCRPPSGPGARAIVLGLAAATVGGLASGLVAGCGPSYRGEPLRGAFEPADPEIALGERVFFTHCHACHPGGDGGVGFSLNDKPLPGWVIRFQVRTGVGAMPAFPPERLDDEELDALVAYLHALRRHEGASQ